MAMSRIRNIEASLFYYVFDLLSVYVEKDVLTQKDLYTFRFTFEDVNYLKPLMVYINDVPAQGYKVNFNENVLIFDEAKTGIVCTADYYYVPVKVTASFPDMLREFVVLPSVAIEYGESYYTPLELGTSKRKIAKHQFSVGIFAGTASEKYDISEKLIEQVFDKTIPLIDFSTNYPLTPDGFLNPNFNKEAQTIGYLEFEDVVQRSFRSEKYGDIELNVMIIDFVVVDYIL